MRVKLRISRSNDPVILTRSGKMRGRATSAGQIKQILSGYKGSRNMVIDADVIGPKSPNSKFQTYKITKVYFK